MADDGDLVDPEKAATMAMALRKDQRKRKLEWLKREAKAAEHKALQSKRLLEEESRKRARAKVTLNSIQQAETLKIGRGRWISNSEGR